LFIFIYISIISKSFHTIHIYYICYIIFSGYIIFFEVLDQPKYFIFYFDIISFISIIYVSFSYMYIWINIICNLIYCYIHLIVYFLSFYYIYCQKQTQQQIIHLLFLLFMYHFINHRPIIILNQIDISI